MIISSCTQKIEYLASKNFLIYKIVEKYYKNMVKREVRLAEISSKDRVLVIGGGPCPYTGILIHQLTKANVTIIDNVENCVKYSTELINKMGLNKNVNIILQDGLDIDTSKFNVLHIALQITPKKRVIECLKKTAKKGTRILVRIPKETLNRLYSPIEKDFSTNSRNARHNLLSNVGKTALHTVGGEIFEKQMA